ncbi:Serine/threonine-protein kinase PknB [Rubripirellula amarantea]|uniref:Serine/threonine-protein kinase PknB n=1 Tax=Rubripirellula amarantea TaxID=2527999 RepID=A0A5C5WUQ1_9BACT|nr:serine/threonine-protein kinase [Rubripirellula amarantea]TWT54290.1 Serine/threonine-protein kinase PknB [Rubripirellula amarantea]
MAGVDLNQYELGEILGVGTVGTIYAAKRVGSDEIVAVKKLHPNVSQDPNIRARFEREMLILSRLTHPNIIAYYGGGDMDGQLFYIMELVDGGTVKDLLARQGMISWPVVAELARQICSALQHAHNYGVVHRDLKPGNLFLTRNGELKLGDFGIARDLHNTDLTHSGMTVGTHAYMAPEQITGDTSISGKADLYALGCCLYEMLTGQKVFPGENFAQLFERHLHSTPPHVKNLIFDCPDEMDAIIHQCLEKKVEDRPFNARTVQGVMLELAEKYDLSHAKTTADRAVDDVPADHANSRSRQMLIDQIRQETYGQSFDNINWKGLAWVVAGIAVVIALIALLNQ